MEAFMHQGRHLDPVSDIYYEWRSEIHNFNNEIAVYMTATSRERQVKITATFTERELHSYGEDLCVREAMARAERRLTMAPPVKQENTRGVLRHLVQMAKAVAA